MPLLEVLVCKFLAIDRFATGPLDEIVQYQTCGLTDFMKTYVATGEVTTLEHEVGDHTVKL